jgi:hypothetical protein
MRSVIEVDKGAVQVKSRRWSVFALRIALNIAVAEALLPKRRDMEFFQ